MAGQWNDLFMVTAEPLKTNLCQYGKGCFGCCSEKCTGKAEVWAGIEKNTREYHEYIRYNQLIAFRDRYGPAKRGEAGVCPNFVMLANGKFGCPLHPMQNQGMDVRKGFCNIVYLCRTFKSYLSWDEKKRQRFLRFIDNKKLDWYDYSIGMTDSILLDEFEKLEKNPLRKWFGH